MATMVELTAMHLLERHNIGAVGVFVGIHMSSYLSLVDYYTLTTHLRTRAHTHAHTHAHLLTWAGGMWH